MSTLVTGGAGFIGSHLIERLLASRGTAARIVCLDNFNADYDPALKRANVALFAADPRVTVIEGSFADENAVRRLLSEYDVTEIVHLGAHAGVRSSVDRALEYQQNNVEGTRALLMAARGRRLVRFVLISSSTVYGLGAAVPFQEDAPLGTPLSCYGASKRKAELVALECLARDGVPVVCLRPFSVYGPRIRPDLALHIFADAIARRRPIPLLGDGSFRRDFTHVHDVCEGLMAAMRAEAVVGEAINLGHNEPVVILDLIHLLEQELGQTAIIEQRPASPADMPLTCADLTKARRLLGYEPKIGLAEGVRDFVAWFRSRAAD